MENLYHQPRFPSLKTQKCVDGRGSAENVQRFPKPSSWILGMRGKEGRGEKRIGWVEKEGNATRSTLRGNDAPAFCYVYYAKNNSPAAILQV